jgi:hypothetical protein
MRKYFILPIFLLLLITCAHTNSYFRLEQAISTNFKKEICIAENVCFSFNADTDFINLLMYYSAERKTAVDSVEYSPYKSTIYIFKSRNDSSYIVLWETEYEYVPILKAYYIAEGNLFTLGELNISLPCQFCESFEYPIKDIQIVQNQEEIEFSFLSNVACRDNDEEEWQIYKAGCLKYCFNIVNKNFKKLVKY